MRRWLSKDVLAGVTAGAVVIPHVMAYATVAGLPVEIGHYTRMVPMFLYALLGWRRADRRRPLPVRMVGPGPAPLDAAITEHRVPGVRGGASGVRLADPSEDRHAAQRAQRARRHG